MTITPGLHLDLPEEQYHGALDWLSASGIKKLIPPSTPAHFKQALGVEVFKPQFDTGKIVHALVLGKGAEFEVVQKVGRDKVKRDADDLKTVSAQAHVAEIRAAGKVPVVRDDIAEAESMAAAVLADPVARALFSNGTAEASAFWIDPATGVQCRARFDWLPDKVEGRRLIVPDLKTANDASPQEFPRAAGKYGYHVQDAMYCDGIKALGIDEDPLFMFVVIEKSSHLVNVLPWSNDSRRLGHAVVDRARRVYRECVEADSWPGYRNPEAVSPPMDLPPYIAYPQEEYASDLT